MKKSYFFGNLIILAAVALLAIIPLLLVQNSEFGGADGLAEEAVGELAPDYQPWFQPLLEPPGAETESLLFALQAAVGAGVVGYAIGFYKGRNSRKGSGE
jgi:cobalt/nickel transport protein